jgi:hypothetical protein
MLLSEMERALNELFRVKELGPDLGFSRFVPGVYVDLTGNLRLNRHSIGCSTA